VILPALTVGSGGVEKSDLTIRTGNSFEQKQTLVLGSLTPDPGKNRGRP